MGTFLALARRASAWCVAIACLGLAACSSDGLDGSTDAFVADLAGTLAGQVLAPRAPAPPLTRASIASIEAPLIQIRVERSGATAPALPFARNGDAQTWLTGDQIALVIKDGVLFATRGLGPDLLAAETTATLRAVRAGGMDRYTRNMRFLDGDDALRVERYFCEMENDGPTQRVVLEVRHATRQMRETCYALDGPMEFRNVYWIGADGTVWDSRQWISRDFGYVRISRLIR